MLEHKQDFALTRENWRRFWAGELERPIVIAVVPKRGVEPVAHPRWGAAYTQPHEAVVDQALRWAETHEFLADAVPWHTPSICIGLFGGMLGGEILETREDWGVDTRATPFLKELDPAALSLRRDSKWFLKYVDLLETYRHKATGALVFGEMCWVCALDLLAEIRGTAETMMDFYDDPAGVHRVLARLLELELELLAELRLHCDFDGVGGAVRHGFYCPGVTGVPQCDLGFAIGKEAFDEFALPSLRQECSWLDGVLYHLDGEGNLKHLDSLCGIEDIGAFQWVAGAGNAGRKDWSGLYDDIAARQKGIWFNCPPEAVIPLWRRHRNAGRLCMTVHSTDPDAVKRLMDNLERLVVDGDPP